MSFWNYLSSPEKIKYIVLELMGGLVGIGVVILGFAGKMKSWAVLLVVFSIVVPLLSRALKLRITAYKRTPPEKLSEKEKKDWRQIEKLVSSAKRSKREKKLVFLVFVFCVIFSLLGYLYLFLRYPDVMRIIFPLSKD